MLKTELLTQETGNSGLSCGHFPGKSYNKLAPALPACHGIHARVAVNAPALSGLTPDISFVQVW